MRIGSLVLLVWLLIGLLAAGQRHYLTNTTVVNCSWSGTVAVTILAGPLNYVGMNPKVSCQTPQPSK